MSETAQVDADPVPRVSLRQKLAYGMGAVTDMIGYHGPVTLELLSKPPSVAFLDLLG